MIPDLTTKVERQHWQKELKQAFTSVDDLLAFLNLSADDCAIDRNSSFRLQVPRAYAEKMQKGNPNCPLLRQVLPTQEENKLVEGFSADPLLERSANPLPGLLRKFKSQALLITTQSCAIHCRYCFRRHFPYAENRLNKQKWREVFAQIQQDPDLYEVILSGGDPLNLSDDHLQWFIEQLQAIDHIQAIRIHTRTGVVLPSRLSQTLVEHLSIDKKVIVVFHANHPNELDQRHQQALKAFTQNGITLLNQSVLLKGVNDCGQTLIDLSKKLFDCGILPYYLHVLDPVQGSAHFDTSAQCQQHLMHELQRQLPGYLVPRLVQEVAKAPYKIPINLTINPPSA